MATKLPLDAPAKALALAPEHQPPISESGSTSVAALGLLQGGDKLSCGVGDRMHDGTAHAWVRSCSYDAAAGLRQAGMHAIGQQPLGP